MLVGKFISNLSILWKICLCLRKPKPCLDFRRSLGRGRFSFRSWVQFVRGGSQPRRSRQSERKKHKQEREREEQEKGGAGQIVNRKAIVLLSGMGPVAASSGRACTAPWRKRAPLIVPKEWWSYDGPIVRPPSSYLYTRNTCTHARTYVRSHR